MVWSWNNRDFRQELEYFRRRNQENRNRYLIPPPSLVAEVVSESNVSLLEKAVTITDKAKEIDITQEKLKTLLHMEASASSAIEQEFRKEKVRQNQIAIQNLMLHNPDKESLLQCHATLMKGQNHAQPGQYRTVQVRVGQHKPPSYTEVTKLMNGLYHYINGSKDSLPVKAAWAHIQFETIHPFADGNGRTGRAIIMQIVGLPIPISVEILKQHSTYYDMLDHGNWEKYLEWFLNCYISACSEILNEGV